MRKIKTGFTLIELLVVIAIIGILSSTVLISLNSARGKANDVKIKSDVKQIKTILETNYDGISYPDLTNDSPIAGGLVADGNIGSSSLTTLLGDIGLQGSFVWIQNEPSEAGQAVLSYAVYGRLVSTTTQYYCMDSAGKTSEGYMDPPVYTATCPDF